MDYPFRVQWPDAHTNRGSIVDRFDRPIAYVRPGYEKAAEEIVAGANRDADPAAKDAGTMAEGIRAALTSKSHIKTNAEPK